MGLVLLFVTSNSILESYQYITLINQYTEFSQVLLHLYGNEKVFPESSFCIVLSYGDLKIVTFNILLLYVLDRKKKST